MREERRLRVCTCGHRDGGVMEAFTRFVAGGGRRYPREWAVRALALPVSLVLSGCVYVSGGINPFSQQRGGLQETVVEGEGRDKVVLLDISEVITDVEEEGTLGFSTEESTVARVQEMLDVAADDGHVRAVVLRINSPGGGVTASDAIFHALLRFKADTRTPVIASLQDLATSGAYYVALAADRIVASPTTVTGSIGVILLGLNVEGLMTKIGVSDQTVKSGVNKDLLSPFRRPTEEERRIVQGVIDDLYHRFVTLVRQRRKDVPAADLPWVTDGRIFTASQALELGLVDDVGYLDDAIEDAKAAARIETARVVMYHRADEYRENLYSGRWGAGPGGRTAGGMELTLRLPRMAGPRFMYLWAPGAATLP